ncbi:M23 family metallopeptidase [Roseivirga sp. BDSF3-8]|uniref:M23 family metallopeptidase n=1 Tax=Roseivirga sp. BDSF3-8 TaxID=3241598 RepID=UPI0035318A6E
MARIKYYYDTETCRYERVKVSKWDTLLNGLGFLCLALILAVGLVWLYSLNFEMPKEAQLREENEELKLYYELVDEEMGKMRRMMAALQDRDDNVYRVIFEADPIPDAVRQAGTGGAQRYKELMEQDLSQGELMMKTFKKIDKLKKQMLIQTNSYDEINRMAEDKNIMLASIPAIQPVSNKELKRLASGYGMRIHPIYKTRRMHEGIDFSAPRGTPIYATGNGKVTVVRSNFSGYGKEVVIDHGYGYKTRYAHMESFNVRQGQEVKRGECIGYVGNTGSSTAPHCHYEVIKDNEHVNPVHYFFKELNSNEYDKILELASVENQSLS